MEILTTNQYADIFAEKYPEIWKLVNTKHIDPPGNYTGFKLPAVSMASALIECKMEGRSTPVARNIAVGVNVLQHYNFPTYYVGKELFEALKHTNPPESKTWEDMFWPFPGLIFMLPIGTLKEQPSGEDINFIAVVLKPKGVYKVLGSASGKKEALYNEVSYDLISVFWGIQGGVTIQDVTFPLTVPLKPSANWIREASERTRRDFLASGMTDCNEEFSSYMCALAANLLLIMTARKDLVEHSEARAVRTLKSGLKSYSPTFIGRKYAIVRKTSRKSVTGAHFTELDWRAGYMGIRHVGHGENKEPKVIYVEPYIAFTKGLVRTENANIAAENPIDTADSAAIAAFKP